MLQMDRSTLQTCNRSQEDLKKDLSLQRHCVLRGGCNGPTHGGFHTLMTEAIVAATARYIVEEGEKESGGKEGEMHGGREIQWGRC